MATVLKLMTAEEFLLMPDDDVKRELVRGVLIEDMPPGYEHGAVEAQIGRLLGNFAADNDFGEVLSGDSGFILERGPDTVRGPDVAWVAPGRIEGRVRGFAELAPDLVVEVRSPNDSQRHMAERALMWLSHGVRMAIVADPGRSPSPSMCPDSRRRCWEKPMCSMAVMSCPVSRSPSGGFSAAGNRA